MKKNHIGEIVNINGLDIIAEVVSKPNLRETIPVGKFVETLKINKMILVVLDDLYEPLIPGTSVQTYGIDEEELLEKQPHANEYIRYLIKVYPIAEINGEDLSIVSRSPVMNALLFDVGSEKLKKLFDIEQFDVIQQLCLIDIRRFPKRNKAIINAIKTYVALFSEEERLEVIKELVERLSRSLRNDFSSLMEIVRGVKM